MAQLGAAAASSGANRANSASSSKPDLTNGSEPITRPNRRANPQTKNSRSAKTPDRPDLRCLRLLDCREQPMAAPRAHECPEFGRFAWTVIFDRATARAIHHSVSQRKAHCHGRVVGRTFAPGFGQVALLESHVRHFVDHASARVLRKLLGKIGKHFRSYFAPQRREILIRISGLDFS